MDAKFPMETRIDFVQLFPMDMSLDILKCLNDPADLIRASLVSHLWRRSVVVGGLSKQLCLRMFPQLTSVARIIEPSDDMKSVDDVENQNCSDFKILERDHRVYAALLHSHRAFPLHSCIEDAVSASSTDNYPEESIINTLNPRDRILRNASYWSSEGQNNPTVPERLIYKLTSGLCVITEIMIRPFEAFFQDDGPIYSAKSVQFRFGHLRSPCNMDVKKLPLQQCANDEFTWTYTSQEFSMSQENCLQKFELAQPVLCIGGFLQIELLGRVQKQETDGLFYICISHVQVLGRELFPAFEVEILKNSVKFFLKFFPLAFHQRICNLSTDGPHTISPSMHPLAEQMVWEHLEDLVGFLIQNRDDADEPADWEDGDNEV